VNHKLLAIADRIDAEHERQLEVLYRDMSDAEYVKLPKDADGEYIHVGDVMDGYGKTIEVVELRYGRSGWVLISRDGNGYADTFAFAHHHAPTVDELLDQLDGLRGNGADYEGVVTRASEIAEKLRELLKEDA
jgi:hypothetical protein